MGWGGGEGVYTLTVFFLNTVYNIKYYKPPSVNKEVEQTVVYCVLPVLNPSQKKLNEIPVALPMSILSTIGSLITKIHTGGKGI